MVGAMSKKHMGSSVDEFVQEQGIFEEAQAQAVKEVAAWQLAEAINVNPAVDAACNHSLTVVALKLRVDSTKVTEPRPSGSGPDHQL